MVYEVFNLLTYGNLYEYNNGISLWKAVITYSVYIKLPFSQSVVFYILINEYV